MHRNVAYAVNVGNFSSMTRLGTDYRLDAGLIAAAILELLLALATTIISSRTICSTVRVRVFSFVFPLFVHGADFVYFYSTLLPKFEVQFFIQLPLS